MTVTIDGTTGIDKVGSGVVDSTALASNAVTQPKVASGVAGSGPAFSAYQTNGNANTLSSGTFTKITFDTEEFDTNNNFASSRFTPTVAGYYQISAAVSMNVYTSGVIETTNIYKNGSIYKYSGNFYPQNTGINRSGISALVYCNGTTDYIEIYGYQYGGSSPATYYGVEQTYFQAALVRAA